MSCASALATSGRRSSNADGRPGATFGSNNVVERAGPHRHRLRRPADQNSQPNDLLLHFAAQVGEGGANAGDQRFLLCDIQRRGGASLHPATDHRQRLFRVGQVLPRHRKLVGETERVEPGAGDAGHHGQRHGLLVEPAEHGARHRRLARGQRLAPEVQRIGSVQAGAVVVHINVVAACAHGAAVIGVTLLHPTRAAGCAERRQQRRAGNAHLRVGLLHPGDGGEQVEVLAPGLGDQGVEVGRAKAAPPVSRGPRRGRGRRAGAVGGRDVQGWAMVVRTKIAAGQRQQRGRANAPTDRSHPRSHAPTAPGAPS